MAARLLCGVNGCQRTFTSNQSLETHHRRSHEANPLVCGENGCVHRANDASNMRRHKRMKHPGTQQGVQRGPKVHTCQYCGKVFGSRGDNLKRHAPVCNSRPSASSAPLAALAGTLGSGTVAATTVPAMGNIVAAPQPLQPQQQQQQQQQQLPTPPGGMMGYTFPLVPVPWDDLIDPELFASHFPDPAADAAAAVAVAAAAATLPTPPIGLAPLPELVLEDWAGLEAWDFAHIAPAAPADLGFGPAFTAEQWEQAEQMTGLAAGPFVMPEFVAGGEQQPMGELSFEEQFGDFVDFSGGVSSLQGQ